MFLRPILQLSPLIFSWEIPSGQFSHLKLLITKPDLMSVISALIITTNISQLMEPLVKIRKIQYQ